MTVLEVNDEHHSENSGVTVALNGVIESLANLTDFRVRFHLACVRKAEWRPSAPVQLHVLITGGSGFIGTNAVAHGLAVGHEVLNIDIAPPRNPEPQSCQNQIDILDKQELITAVSRFDPIHAVHLAARSDLGETKNLPGQATIIEGTENVMDAIIGCPAVRHAAIASTPLVCRVGDSPASDRTQTPVAPQVINTADSHSRLKPAFLSSCTPPPCAIILRQPCRKCRPVCIADPICPKACRQYQIDNKNRLDGT